MFSTIDTFSALGIRDIASLEWLWYNIGTGEKMYTSFAL